MNNPYGRKARHEIIHQQVSRPGMRGRVNAMCVDCVYDPSVPGNWRQQVSACGVTECPLHPIRPRSSSEVSE